VPEDSFDSDALYELDDGTIVRRIPTTAEGDPIREPQVVVAQVPAPPPSRRIPSIRVIAVLEDLSGQDRPRAVVAFPALRVFPTRDGIDLGDLGFYSIVGVAKIKRSNYPEVLPGEALFEVTLRRD
jgi:hypothetical protein